jgi:hypothetical protein
MTTDTSFECFGEDSSPRSNWTHHCGKCEKPIPPTNEIHMFSTNAIDMELCLECWETKESDIA